MIQEITLTKNVQLALLYNEIMASSFASKIDTQKNVSSKGIKLKVHLTEALSNDELTELNDIITNHAGDKEIFLRQVKDAYEQRTGDGVKFYSRFRGGLLLDLQSGALKYQDGKVIVASTQSVMNYLTTGDWLSAHDELSGTNTNAKFTNAIKDQLLDDLKAYINSSYPESLHIP